MITKVSNWGNYPKIEAKVENFKYDDELGEKCRSGGNYIVRGNGRCYGDAALSENIISTLKFNNILELNMEQGYVTCQSGVTFDELLDIIVPKGWFLPVTPGTKYITVGGAVASDIHGKNHHKEGSFMNHIMDVTLLLASNEVVRCNNELNPDLFKATCGGMGLTGVILQVTFRLKRISTSFIKQLTVKAKDLDEAFQFFEDYNEYTYSVAWIDCLQRGKNLGRSVLMLGEHAMPGDVKKNGKSIQVPKKSRLSIPFDFPPFVLNQYTIKLFNYFYYHKNLSKKRENIVDYETFFYPLDFIYRWNRMYGKQGFVQYQFVLPLEHSREGLIEILSAIAEKGMGSFLAVLKLFGDHESLISFATKGYTLALDFPFRKGLFEFLDYLDTLVLKYGGRIYMAKDARMDHRTFWESYPNASEFREIVRRYNHDFKWRSLQSERLKISG